MSVLAILASIHLLDSRDVLQRGWRDHLWRFRLGLVLLELLRSKLEFQGANIVTHKGVPLQEYLGSLGQSLLVEQYLHVSATEFDLTFEIAFITECLDPIVS